MGIKLGSIPVHCRYKAVCLTLGNMALNISHLLVHSDCDYGKQVL